MGIPRHAPASNEVFSGNIAAREASIARYCAALPNLRANCAWYTQTRSPIRCGDIITIPTPEISMIMSKSDVMQAAWFDKFGPANDVLTLGEIAKPQAAAGEVLIRMKTTGVNPSDVKKRAGAFLDLLDGGSVVPHSDGAGVIESVGEGVSSQRIGERDMIELPGWR